MNQDAILYEEKEKVSSNDQLNDCLNISKNNMDDIDLRDQAINKIEAENQFSDESCRIGTLESCSHESDNSDLQENDDLNIKSYNIEDYLKHIIGQLELKTASEESSETESPVQDLDLGDLSLKSKDDFLAYLKSISIRFIEYSNETKSRHEAELDKYKADNAAASYQAQIEMLEKDLAQAKADAFAWESELKHTKEKLTQENISIRSELTARLDRLMKQCEISNRDKEAMVMKYAKGEKDVLVVKKQKENLEKKMKELERDKEILQGKIKNLTVERTRICNTLDNKVQENGISLRNIEKLKEEINAKDIKIKWGQTRLKSEMDAHKDTQGRLDRVLAKLCNTDEEIAATREAAERTVKETREGENTRANVLEKQAKEAKALLILETQKYNDVNALYKLVKSEHEALRSSHILLDTEATTLRVKVAKYEHERAESEKLFESLQTELKNVKEEALELSQKLSTSSVYAEQLESEKVKCGFAEKEIQTLQTKLEEQSAEMSKCREKEAELLSFTQKLTNDDATLRSQLTASRGKVRLLEVEHKEMKEQSGKLALEVTQLTKELNQLAKCKELEESRLSSLLEEQTKLANDLQTQVSDLQNEIHVQRKKQVNALKDSNREVQKLRKKLEALENSTRQPLHQQTGLPPPEGSTETAGLHMRNGETTTLLHDTISLESRASSDLSLNADSYHINGSAAVSQTECGETPCRGEYTPPTANTPPNNDLPEQHVLIERILKQQKSIMKKAEKIEFLEEHVAQLVAELKKKNKIIHHYIMKEEPGALGNSKSDDAKAEIMKHGGIMAALYGSSAKDGTMTLDLSLEINRKLQAVLEDTLLKNITLKENLNTLGDEVAKLALQNSSVLKPP